MEIGTIIKKHRRERDMTQEQLAEYLRVSVPAVSQWESGKTAPDLALIPVICNLFGISADELLGINREQKEQRIEEIIENAKRYYRGHHKESTAILEAGLLEYPDSYKLMHHLMNVHFWQYKPNDNDTMHFLDQSIHLANRILQGCTDSLPREVAKQILCYAYNYKGETEKALEIAQDLPHIYITRELFLAYLTKGTDGYRSHQELTTKLMMLLEEKMGTNRQLDGGAYAYTEDEMALIHHKRLALYELLIEDGNYGCFHTELSRIHIALAQYYGSKQDTENTLHHLSASAEHAIASVQTFMQNEEFRYTCLLLRGYNNIGQFISTGQDNDALQTQQYMAFSVFDFLRDTPAFTAILARLEPVAGEWKVKDPE